MPNASNRLELTCPQVSLSSCAAAFISIWTHMLLPLAPEVVLHLTSSVILSCAKNRSAQSKNFMMSLLILNVIIVTWTTRTKIRCTIFHMLVEWCSPHHSTGNRVRKAFSLTLATTRAKASGFQSRALASFRARLTSNTFLSQTNTVSERTWEMALSSSKSTDRKALLKKVLNLIRAYLRWAKVLAD